MPRSHADPVRQERAPRSASSPDQQSPACCRSFPGLATLEKAFAPLQDSRPPRKRQAPTRPKSRLVFFYRCIAWFISFRPPRLSAQILHHVSLSCIAGSSCPGESRDNGGRKAGRTNGTVAILLS